MATNPRLTNKTVAPFFNAFSPVLTLDNRGQAGMAMVSRRVLYGAVSVYSPVV